ncbi:MAG: UDP-N-acetylglucosamine--N-acetylmuramyl-(pentapeptide) pyrophosphoryl-undecaprenol N-acetylglucosamine transferase [Phycisphaerales bacterium]|nr:UDP-N-acetylglucosamine--N-acetylmuramyl-(pentapeptide) pyrophosphoryl-undecaprenol N-acetylglucosamine transferase [Phycisphaerae bacterium]NNF43784.1 UDP-N-acetylglucosamine--N-acetylmuramyl-(pentapeptide) pyrophosphoryl-undecaprenol N-acetylglucosamine transferase [Phycisphaerales bacterium]NNM26880.1 UDP-N-acetylglucosamine--N-acetylmuramyl-(pentapeptide) pyrophosphoryl-undecaprenol N-acetylglucosamine transferase [Phycisphaerales bacterium]
MSDADPATPVALFAGGGSGGHLSPALAVWERLRESTPSVRAIFACSERAIDARMLLAAETDFRPLPARPAALRPGGLVRFIDGFRRSRRQVRGWMRAEPIDVVLALGGFVAAPVVAAARDERVPVILLNLDDPPGRANRWIARRSDDVWSAIGLRGDPSFASRITGLPLRHCAVAGPERTAGVCRTQLGLAPDRLTLLVTGASQGAKSLNTLMEVIASRASKLLRGWQVLHLSGPRDETTLREHYAAAGIPARVIPFLDEMGLAWGAADVAISRAGANSVAEIVANAVPTLFLPYPYHRDQHQRNNARPLVDAAAARLETDRIEADANLTAIRPVLSEMLLSAPVRARLRRNLEALRGGDAAADVARGLLSRMRVAAGAASGD